MTKTFEGGEIHKHGDYWVALRQLIYDREVRPTKDHMRINIELQCDDGTRFWITDIDFDQPSAQHSDIAIFEAIYEVVKRESAKLISYRVIPHIAKAREKVSATVNLNDTVRFKPNDLTRGILVKNGMAISGDGYCRMQMHQFARVFGPSISPFPGLGLEFVMTEGNSFEVIERG